MTAPARPRTKTRHCGWCGAALPASGGADAAGTGEGAVRAGGRPRRYCGQACRQRAYERRGAVQRGGLPDDAVVLSAAELSDLQDRLFQLRCAAEDVITAVRDGAGTDEVTELAEEILRSAKGLERLR